MAMVRNGYGTKWQWYEMVMVRKGFSLWYEMAGTKWLWYEMTVIRDHGHDGPIVIMALAISDGMYMLSRYHIATI